LPVAVSLKRFCAPLWVFNFSLIFLGLGNAILQTLPLTVRERVAQGQQRQASEPAWAEGS
jgi:hypothetical protein